MTKRMKRLFSVILVVSMIISLLSVSAFAEENITAETDVFKCVFAYEHTHTALNGSCYETQLTCTRHAHGEQCYTDGVLTCTDGVLDQICGVVEEGHTHINIGEEAEGQEACYQYHVHVGEAEAKDCYGRVTVCGLDEHTHTPNCLKDDVKAAFDDAVTKLEGIDSLQEMQDNRANFTVSGDFNAGNEASVTEHTNAQTGYADYRADMLVLRKAAQDAYNALDPAAQKLIDPALVEKLSDELETWWVVDHNPTMSRTIKPATVDSYDYQLIQTYSRLYERTPHFTAAGKAPGLFILVDSSEKEGTWTWMADGRYTAGQSNYELAYCSDVSVTTVDGTHYKRTNLEENGYYGVDAAEHIRAIVVNSYPFVTMDEMRANLIAGGLDPAMVNQLDRGEMIAAVQMAIWSFANGETDAVEGNTSYGRTYRLSQGLCFHDYTNEHDYWWDSANGYGTYYPEIGNRINTVVEYLRGLKGLSLTDKDIIITGVDILGAEPVQATGREGVYNVAMKIQLNGGGSSVKDNITITATSYTENEDGTRNITGTSETKVNGNTVYDLVVEARYGEYIEVAVAGTQHLPQGAYFYQPQPSDRNGDGVYTSKETSQNLVGVAMGDTNVSAKKIITDNGIPSREEENPVSAKLTLKKTNETGTPLTGAEFTVYRVSDDGKNVYNIGTYPVDENGCAVLTGLLEGTYQLQETKAPEGYVAIDETVIFEVTNGETAEIRLFNNPDDVRCDGAEDGYILTVVNCETPPPAPTYTSVSVTKVWDDADNQDGLRPESITVQLLRNGRLHDTKVLSEGNWSASWTGLDDFFTWTVAEADVPEGYTSSVSGSGNSYTITNTHVPYSSLSVQKVWDDEEDKDGIRPDSVQVELLENGAGTGTVVTLSDENGWAHTWTQLNGESQWSVSEINVPEGYTSSVTVGDGYVAVTNTHVPEEPPITPEEPPVMPEEPPVEPEPEEPAEEPEEEDPLFGLDDGDTPLGDKEMDDPLYDMEDGDTPYGDMELGDPDAPKTADNSATVMWMMIALLSAAALVGIRVAERKER